MHWFTKLWPVSTALCLNISSSRVHINTGYILLSSFWGVVIMPEIVVGVIGV